MQNKCRYIAVWCLFLLLGLNAGGQTSESISLNFIRKEFNVLPDKVINIPLFVKNNSADSIPVKLNVNIPEAWSFVTKLELNILAPHQQKFLVISTRIPASCLVGRYNVEAEILGAETGELYAKEVADVSVAEVENISLQLIESVENILAGETYKARYLVQNLGNTEKTVFIETLNCDVEGDALVKLLPGESSTVNVVKKITEEVVNTRKEYISVSAMLGGKLQDKIFRPLIIFPVKRFKKDLYFRYPVNASLSYLASNPDDVYESGYQFEISGRGTLDPQGKHRLEFLARGPNNTNLSYLGTYDQYFVNYSNKNVDVTLGERAYKFTPLTESSRYGMGAETKVMLNNGLSAGFIYVKPRFFDDIQHEMAAYSQYEKNKNTKLGLYLIQKKNTGAEDLIYLFSLSSSFKPLKKTTVELEASRGFWGNIADNAFRGHLNSQFSIFSVAGSYYNAGTNYPGYYSNSTFYSGSLSAQLSKKVNVGVFARQDFSNAELDTFFVTAPYTRAMQYFFNYNIAPRTYLKVYWRENERKDRLSEEKFHYKTRSLNSQLNQRFNRFSYSLVGEYGRTTNYLLSEVSNEQNTYRVSTNLGFQFNSQHSVRVFGSYSNLNSFVSDDQQNVTAGLSVSSRFGQKLRANLYLQNAYNIDDYYRNRNLMQFNLDYKLSKKHEVSFRSYYTLFRSETENPDFFLSATYKYKFGVPIKQMIKAGDFSGRLIRNGGEPIEGVLLKLLNKTAITNKNGEFEFSAVPPGVYMLSIDRSKLEFNEMPDMPRPIKIEIIEDNETVLNIGITQGAKLKGKILPKASDGSELKSADTPEVGNIVIELSNEIETFRIVTEDDGSFSFPLVLPGEWTLKIYENNIPKEYQLLKKEYGLNFKPGDIIEFDIDLKQKKRKIIFKSQNISLSNSGSGGLIPLKTTDKVSVLKTTPAKAGEKDIIYTVQVGAFSKKIAPSSSFFKGRHFDFEMQINNLYKYLIGRFSTLAEAKQMQRKLKEDFKGAFVVAIKDGRLIYVSELKNK